MHSKKKGKLGLLIGALLIASGVVAAGAIVYNSSDTKKLPEPNEAIKTGDVIRYHVIGQRDGASVSGTVSIIFSHVSEDGSEKGILIEHDGNMGYWAVHAFGSQLFDPYGKCIGSQWMDTAYGDRFVKRLIDYYPRAENSSGVFRNTYVGVESEIAYRVNVSGPGYHLKAELTDATVYGMYRWDKREVTVRADWDEVGDGPTMFTLGPGALDGGPFMLQQEGDIRISCDGNDSAAFFITEDNINSMDRGAPFVFDAELSITDGRGTRQGVLEPGLYYVIGVNLNDTSFTAFVYEVDFR